jgi:hypothetical protein
MRRELGVSFDSTVLSSCTDHLICRTFWYDCSQQSSPVSPWVLTRTAVSWPDRLWTMTELRCRTLAPMIC